ncbi:hypothetical protein [Allokutzneria sp. NRRL B-24872]|uniref:hypothetical protein n=1 Tax=Allokutzneria sp. NRRL B-24872 TaxID=1137961 RepID=UPI000A39CDE4
MKFVFATRAPRSPTDTVMDPVTLGGSLARRNFGEISVRAQPSSACVPLMSLCDSGSKRSSTGAIVLPVSTSGLSRAATSIARTLSVNAETLSGPYLPTWAGGGATKPAAPSGQFAIRVPRKALTGAGASVDVPPSRPSSPSSRPSWYISTPTPTMPMTASAETIRLPRLRSLIVGPPAE